MNYFLFHAMGLYAQCKWCEWSKVLKNSVKYFKYSLRLYWLRWKVFGLYGIKWFFRTPLDVSTILFHSQLAQSFLSIGFTGWSAFIIEPFEFYETVTTLDIFVRMDFFSGYKRKFNSSKLDADTVNGKIDHQIGQFFPTKFIIRLYFVVLIQIL